MKLTIKSDNQVKIIDLNKDLELSAVKGEQYVFSNGFASYTLNFKDDQQTVSLQFNVDGKVIKVDLKGIVPFLQENSSEIENPTAIIINKTINEGSIDNVIQNDAFNGSEIIDKLEALITNPVDLGKDLTLISDFQTLIEALDAAAAGGEQGTSNTNASSFNSIFSPLEDSLNDIGETDIWENLSESISSVPVDTGTLIVTNDETEPTPEPEPDAETALVSIAGAQTIIEGNTSTEYTVSVDQPATDVTSSITVNLTYTGTAKDGTDFTGVKTVTIPAGSNSTTFTIDTIDDVLAEGAEDFTITIDSITDTNFENIAANPSANSVESIIIDDKTPGTEPDAETALVSIAGAQTIIEGNTSTEYTVSVDQPATDVTSSITVNLTYTGTAKDGTDFTGVKTVTIPAGSNSTTFTIDTIDDVLAEGAEDFTITIDSITDTNFENIAANPSANSVESIIIDDKTPGTEPDAETALVSIAGAQTIIEGNTSTEYTVSVDQPATDVTSSITVNLTYTGTAKDGTDFTGVKTVTIPAGSNSTTFTIDTIDDVLAEGAEDFTITIDSITDTNFENIAANPSANSVESIIIDDKTPGTEPDAETALVSIAGAQTIIEGNTSTEYTVSVDQPATDVTSSITVNLTYTGTAKDGTDFTGVKTVTIPAGSNSTTFTIDTIDDVLAEGAEDFTITIDSITDTNFENIAANPSANSVESIIIDDKTPGTEPDAETALVSIAGAQTIIEGNTSTEYTVSVDQPATDVTSSITVNLTYTGTAKDGTDFTGVKTVTIPAGSNSTTFTIDTIDDVLAEGAEDFTITIDSITDTNFENIAANPSANSVESIIIDDKTPGTEPDAETALVSIAGAQTIIEGNTSTEYTVSVDQPATDVTSSITVNLTYTGTAKDGTDFTGVKTVTIPAGSNSTTFTIDTIDDVLAEGAEDFTITIDSITDTNFENIAANPSANSVESIIIDDKTPGTEPDAETALVSIAGAQTIIEGNTSTEYTVSVDQPATDVTSSITVNLTYTGTAKDGTDFTGVKTVTIPAGSNSTTFTIDTIDDVLAEGAEDFTITIDSITDTNFENIAANPSANSVESIIIDDKTPGTEPDAETALVSIAGAQTIIEGNTSTEYTVSVDQPATDVTSSITVNLTYTGTAKDGTDFTGVKTVTIPAGSNSTTFTIDTIDDVLAEGAEDFTITIDSITDTNFENIAANPSANSVESIIIDDKTPGTEPDAETALVSIAGAQTIIEGNTSTEYTVSVDQPATDVTSSITVNLTYTGTAKDGTDFTGVKTVTIPAGSNSTTFTIDTIDDVLAEGAEDFTITIDSITDTNFENIAANPSANSVESIIIDDKTPGTEPDAETALVSIAGAQTIIEGNTSTEYTVSVDQPATDVTSSITVNLTYTGTAKDGTDFTGVKTVTIPAGSNSTTFTIDTIDDVLAEGAEDFTITIDSITDTNFENIAANPSANSVESIIIDDKTPGTEPDAETALVSIAGAQTIIEGNTSTEYTVSVDQPATDVTSSITVNLTYTGTAKDGTDFTGVKTVTIPAGSNSTTFTIDTIDDVLAEGAEDFTITIDSITDTNFENIAANPNANSVESIIVDETNPYTPEDPDQPNEKDNVNVKLVGIDTAVTEGESATYKVTLTDDKGNPVVAKEDMEVTFTYTYTTASGDDITETVSVTIPAGSSEAPVSVKTIDDVYAEGTEEFTIEINTVSNQDQFENVTVDKTPVETTITDESDPSNPTDPETPGAKDNVNVKLVGVNTDVVEGESATYKVTLTDDKGNPVVAKEDMEVTFTYTYTTASGDDITETVSVTIPAGSSEAPVSVKTIDDVYAEGTEEFTIEINTVSNQDQFEQVTVDKTPVETTITDNDYKLTTDDSFSTKEDTPYTLNINDFGTPLTTITKVKIVEVPTNGQLLLNGTIVNAGQEINRIDIDSGKLVFKPNSNTDENGNFEFLVNDGTKWANVETTTEIIVTAVADTPITSMDAVKLSSGEYTVKIDAALTDTDGSETLTVKISNVPNGAELSSTKYEVTKNADGSWNVKVPAGETSISDTLVMNNVPQGTDWVNLKITATATEKNDNIDGKNFAIAEANDSTVHSVEESEQVRMESFNKYNIMITLDNSGSMSGSPITLAKAAMVNLVNKYTDLGEVRVTLNVFNQYGEIKALWVTPAEAISLIDKITAGGGTNYDDALLKNIDTLSKNPAPLDGKTISYFVSDGVPRYGMKQDSNGEWVLNTSAYGVNAELSSQYKNLNFDKSYAIGIGTSELNTHLNAVSNDVIIISDATQLSQTLEDTVQELLVDGNVINNVGGGDGKISIDSIEVNGKEYTNNDFPEDGILLGNNNIKFTFDFETGNYKYYAKSLNFVEEVQSFKVNASDSDGDKTSFDISAKVKIVQGETSNMQNLMGEDIDLTTVITKNTNIISLENSTNDKITIELEDMLVQDDKQLVVKGDLGDIVELDTPSDWANAGKEQLNGVNYNVYTGTGTNSTVKLLIEDDIDVNPDI